MALPRKLLKLGILNSVRATRLIEFACGPVASSDLQLSQSFATLEGLTSLWEAASKNSIPGGLDHERQVSVIGEGVRERRDAERPAEGHGSTQGLSLESLDLEEQRSNLELRSIFEDTYNKSRIARGRPPERPGRDQRQRGDEQTRHRTVGNLKGQGWQAIKPSPNPTWTLHKICEAHRQNLAAQQRKPGTFPAAIETQPYKELTVRELQRTPSRSQALAYLQRRRPANHRWVNEASPDGTSSDISAGATQAQDRKPKSDPDWRLYFRLKKQPNARSMLATLKEAIVAGATPHEKYIQCVSKGVDMHANDDTETLRDLIRFCGDLGIPADSRIYARLVRFMGAFKTHYAIRGILPAYLRDGLVLDHLILESIIKASGRLQAFWYAWDMIGLMEMIQLEPRRETWEALLEMYAAGRKPDDVEELFKAMQASLGKASPKAWAIRVKAWGITGSVGKVEAIMAEMKQAGITPPLAAYASTVSALVQAGSLARARQLAEDAEARHAPPSVSGSTDVSDRIRGFVNDKFVRGMNSALIHGYLKAGRVQVAENLLTKLESKSHGLRADSYVPFLNRFREEGDVAAVKKLVARAEKGGARLGRLKSKFLVEATMQAWHLQGRPLHLLRESVQFFDEAYEDHFKHMSPTNRGPDGLILDLHTLSRWTAQLMIVHFLRETQKRLQAGWEFPQGNMQVITGKGIHNVAGEAALMRDITLRFFQGMFSPQLAARNDGVVVLRRWEVLAYMKAMEQNNQVIDAEHFSSKFV